MSVGSLGRASASASSRGVAFWALVTAAVLLPLAAIVLSVLNVLQATEVDRLAAGQEAIVAQLERRVAAAGGPTSTAIDASAIYVPGATPALAKAALQRLLTDAVEATGGRLIEAQDVEAPGQAQDLVDDRVRLRVTFDTRNGPLLELLRRIETGLPLLTVERLEIRRLDAAADADPDDPTLRVGVVINGPGRFVAG
ncbi:type II secretion system protein GspM [Methylopila sp. Yamaguchi]|uniref:type II secretion system protein GspM n=1 Tax=Methylopila sp. Yamaguchi TaxID=1437817 RepID=UPI000CB5D8B6|nr:type II secretion system protein GspM [Methylopila sp. Yamaguchi]GBD50532.1 hypothetical protein METY_3745 [Methylopila sp. Yamaguchi]